MTIDAEISPSIVTAVPASQPRTSQRLMGVVLVLLIVATGFLGYRVYQLDTRVQELEWRATLNRTQTQDLETRVNNLASELSVVDQIARNADRYAHTHGY